MGATESKCKVFVNNNVDTMCSSVCSECSNTFVNFSNCTEFITESNCKDINSSLITEDECPQCETVVSPSCPECPECEGVRIAVHDTYTQVYKDRVTDTRIPIGSGWSSARNTLGEYHWSCAPGNYYGEQGDYSFCVSPTPRV